jgi:hypothetical protein
VVVKGYVNYGYTSSIVLGYGSIPAVRHVRFEDVNFVTTQNKFAGKNVAPILFKNVKWNGTVVKSVDQLTKAGWDISVPMKFQ